MQTPGVIIFGRPRPVLVRHRRALVRHRRDFYPVRPDFFPVRLDFPGPSAGPFCQTPLLRSGAVSLLANSTDEVAVSSPGDEPRDDRLTEHDAEAHVHGICFKTGPPRRVGLELEWLVHDARDPALPVPAERIFAAVAGLTAPAVLPSPPRCPPGACSPQSPVASWN